jgi:3-oxoadipate enol-lactonase
MSGASGMATAPDGRTRLYWESAGEGDPVLLIMGLGLSGGAWWRTVPVLSRRLRVITFDHRGVGRSSAFSYAYTTEALADDAMSVLDDAGLDRAHVYGISLGGMIAQQLALRHDPEVMTFFRRRPGMRAEEAARASVPFNYGPRCRAEHLDRIEEDIAQRLAHPFAERAYRAQAFAAGLHNCYGRLPRIDVSTLVVHGRHDRMIPVANAQLIAERIPGARLRILEESGHLYATEEPQVDDSIAAFLEAAGEGKA